jgi:four helix bundle protein
VASIRRFEDIEGWQLSRDLQETFMRAVKAAPFRNPALQDQMWKCTDSAMSNIAEGFDAGSNPEFVRFLNMAYRSLTEFQSHLHTCKFGRHLSDSQCESFREMARRAKSKVGGFIRYLKAHPKGPIKKSGDKKK